MYFYYNSLVITKNCKFRDENVDLVSNIPLNSFISLRNVRSKISAGGYLEGVIHTDKTFPSLKSVQVLDLNHPAVIEMKM